MSNNTNEILYEDALEVMEYFTGTMIERVIQRDMDADDLEALRYHVNQARRQMLFEQDMETTYEH